jgi:RNA 2',3'-cyclic 3'-phosphodiesterase
MAGALERWAKALQGRATPAAKIHLTLAFLGAVAPEKALSAARRVRASAHALPVEKAQYWKHNKIVWAGPREIPSGLKALVESLHSELYRAEYVLERRPFAAHITLLRNAPAPAALPPLPSVAWPVREFVLARSTVSSKGSSYDIVERFPCD